MAHPLSRLEQYRQALLAADAHADPEICLTAFVSGGPDFLAFVVAQDLGALWHYCLQTNGLLESLPAESIEALRQARRSAAVGYLAQRAALGRLDPLFAEASIAWVAMKGTHVRECVYPDPALRAACDIDVLIRPGDRRRAARVLLDAGYTAHVEPVNISHEATFSQGAVDIDLHWHMLRPGRTRIDMTADLIARRQRTNGVWGLSDDDTLFMMLTHPGFAKYACSPNMGLARVADFLLWVQKQPVDWPAVLQRLERAGLKAAAWVMLSWFRMLAPQSVADILDGWIDSVHPGRLRAAYLHQWLERDLPSRWLDRPVLVQFGFTMLMHDRAGDVLHALRGLLQVRGNRLRDAQALMGEGFGFE